MTTPWARSNSHKANIISQPCQEPGSPEPEPSEHGLRQTEVKRTSGVRTATGVAVVTLLAGCGHDAAVAPVTSSSSLRPSPATTTTGPPTSPAEELKAALAHLAMPPGSVRLSKSALAVQYGMSP